jgi:hypothetical protein
MLRRHQAGKHLQSAQLYGEVVKPVAEAGPAQFHDAQPAAGRTVNRRPLFQRNHAVRDALKLQVRSLGRAIIQ